MEVKLLEVKTKRIRNAMIERVTSKEMPFKKDGWQFTWRRLANIEGSIFFKCVLLDEPLSVQGLVMLTLMNGEMLFMNNIEVAPNNLGSNGQYDRVAGALIAFACMQSFNLGKGKYAGFLAFESKTALIALYQEKYGATLAMGQKMFIDPENGQKLMKEYLNIK